MSVVMTSLIQLPLCHTHGPHVEFSSWLLTCSYDLIPWSHLWFLPGHQSPGPFVLVSLAYHCWPLYLGFIACLCSYTSLSESDIHTHARTHTHIHTFPPNTHRLQQGREALLLQIKITVQTLWLWSWPFLWGHGSGQPGTPGFKSLPLVRT